MDTVIILLLHAIISIATYMGPNTPKAEHLQPVQQILELKAESQQSPIVEQPISENNTETK